ncbi:aldose 1-epimerase family protein [Babesia caballi]|uniref:Aldose 1-epimerase family protein n=1 Tax=Babesia caballi TaxID=5871 RepID=A0AAV4LTV5_BABCB|nr:aldose 1-epimerase family protein [Babesia caballi]
MVNQNRLRADERDRAPAAIYVDGEIAFLGVADLDVPQNDAVAVENVKVRVGSVQSHQLAVLQVGPTADFSVQHGLGVTAVHRGVGVDEELGLVVHVRLEGPIGVKVLEGSELGSTGDAGPKSSHHIFHRVGDLVQDGVHLMHGGDANLAAGPVGVHHHAQGRVRGQAHYALKDDRVGQGVVPAHLNVLQH